MILATKELFPSWWLRQRSIFAFVRQKAQSYHNIECRCVSGVWIFFSSFASLRNDFNRPSTKKEKYAQPSQMQNISSSSSVYLWDLFISATLFCQCILSFLSPRLQLRRWFGFLSSLDGVCQEPRTETMKLHDANLHAYSMLRYYQLWASVWCMHY